MLIITQIIKSLISVFYLNLLFFYFKYAKKKKIIFFYHSESKITDISIDYINYFFLRKNKKNNTFFGYQCNKISKENYFFIKEYFLKFLVNVDYFVTNYVNAIYPKKSKKVYIHHDIYDTPLVAKKLEKKVYFLLSNLDYILISSKIAENIFKNGFKKFKIKKTPRLIISGYLKLAYLENLKEKKKIKKNFIKTIVIAPTQYKSIKSLGLIKSISNISNRLLNNGYRVVLRPHPLNRDEKIFLNFKYKFLKNKNFFYDTSSNYFDTYINSSLMITDISGTAYTYAFFTLNPVIFLSSNKKEKKIKKNFKNNLNYFKNRIKIGKIVLNEKKILSVIKNTQNDNTIKKNILSEKKKFITGNKVIRRINYIFDKLI